MLVRERSQMTSTIFGQFLPPLPPVNLCQLSTTPPPEMMSTLLSSMHTKKMNTKFRYLNKGSYIYYVSTFRALPDPLPPLISKSKHWADPLPP